MRRLAHGVLTALLFAVGCQDSVGPGPSHVHAGRPDLVLVLVTGLRADQPGEHGAEAAFLAPFGGRLALRATAAYAQSLDPAVSLGSVLTGRYPSSIPLCGSIRQGAWSEREEVWCHQLPAARETLPGVLAHYGYRTALFHQLPSDPGLEEAFEHAVDLGTGDPRVATPWVRLATEVSSWWASSSGDPRLLVLQLSDLDLRHRPDLHPDFASDLQGGAVLDLAPWELAGAGQRQAGAVGVLPARRRPCARIVRDRLSLPGRRGVPPDDLQWFNGVDREEALSLYRGEAGAVGDQLSSLLAMLTETPGRSRSVVLAGLRGVSIGEYGGTTTQASRLVWSDYLVDRTMRVPLAVLGAGDGPAAVLEHPVELVDLLPTMLGRAGAVAPYGIPGADLLGEGPDEPLAYAEYGDMLAIRHEDMLLTLRAMVHNISSLDPFLTEVLECPGLVGGFWLHDLGSDPVQELDLLDALPDRAEALEQAMIARRTGLGAPPAATWEDDRLLKLRLAGSEGYW